MTIQIFACFQLIPVLIVTALFAYLWRQRGNVQDRSGYYLLMVTQAGLGLCSMAYGLELIAADLSHKLALRFLRHLGSYTMLLGALFFAFWYTERRHLLKWHLAFIIGIPVWLNMLALGVSGLRHFYYPELWLVYRHGIPQMAHSVGPFYLLMMVYALAVAFVTFYMLISRQLTAPRIYGPGIALATWGYFVTLLGYVLYLIGVRPFGFMNMTYYFSTISAIILTIAVVRYNVHSIRPLGYEAMIRELPIGVVLFDRTFNVVDINLTARRILSLDDRVPLEGRPLPDNACTDQSILDLSAIREAGVMEAAVNGTDLLCSMSEIRDNFNEVAGISLLLQDITERKRADETLRQSEEKHRLLIERLPLAVFVDVQGKMIYVNSAFLTLFRASSADDVIGMRLSDFVSPHLYDTIEKRRRMMLSEMRNLPPLEINLRCLDGTFITVVYTPIPIIFEGQPAILSALYDVTQRKRSEIELQKAHKLLEIQNRQIDELQARLQDKASP